jgi:hypothetical protein
MAAAAAVLGVGGVLELGERERVVVHAEVQRRCVAAEVGDQRIVGVEHERRAAGDPADDLRPAVGDDLQLAVAVELVAEQVAEQDRARRELLDDRREPELVDLEQPEVAVELPAAAPRRGRQRRRDPARHVRARTVVDQRLAGALEHRGGHRGGGRLAVGRADHGAAVGEPARQQADRVRLQPREHLAGQRRPAAAAGAADERPDRLGGGHLGSQKRHGTRTFNARGTTVMVTGRSAIGSPSA